MESTQNERYEALQRAKEFNDNADNAAALAAIDGYAAEQADLDAMLIKIDKANKNAGEEISTASTEKADAKKAMADIVIMYALRANVKAKRAGETDLADKLDHPVTYIFAAKDTDAITNASNLVKLMSDNLGIFTNITQQNITDMQDAIIKFGMKKDVPLLNISKRKSGGTDLIIPLVDQGIEIMDNMQKLLHSYLPGSELTRNFDLICNIVSKGIHHNGIIVHTTDALSGDDLKGAAIVIAGAGPKGSDKKAVTDIDGLGEIIKIKPGTYMSTVSLAGYVSQTFKIKILRGKIIELGVAMKKAMAV